MARINVEQKALTDSRFIALGLMLDEDSPHPHAIGLYLMIHIWNECQERETCYLTEQDVSAIAHGLGFQFSRGVGQLLVDSELSRPTRAGRYYIRGAKDRTTWLKQARKAGKKGAKYGKLGGRPANPQGGIGAKPPGGLSAKPPPAPAPAPTKKKNTSAEPDGPASAPLFVFPDCIRGETYMVSWDQAAEWAKAYPAVNIDEELRRAKAWLDANPTKRKTKRGMPRFLVAWFSRNQNNAGSKQSKPETHCPDCGGNYPPEGKEHHRCPKKKYQA